MKYRWTVANGDGERGRVLSQELGISPLLAGMLVERGAADARSAHAFLNPSLSDLHDPLLMRDMDRTVARIFRARDGGEKVLIYGDYDVDGITSTVVLLRALEMLGLKADFHMPKRLEDGYGLRPEVIREASEGGYGLVVTADAGIRAFEVCGLARELGLDLIVTDHHLPDDRLPEAFAILNPRRPDCGYPEKNLAAVGVVFKLVEALFRAAGRAEVIPHFLKLAAIGTIADLVPVTGENRVICRFGLEGLAEPRNVGLKALLAGAGVSRDVDHFDVGFKVAPRINAVTRMGGGREVVDLFSIRDPRAAESIVRDMNDKNLQRRAEEQAILAEIEERWKEDPKAFDRRFLVVAGRDWHRGVIGIVASRLVDRFYRPTLVLSVGESGCQGSARSIPGFHLLDALDSCGELFGSYGGHAQAAGCRLEAGQSGPDALRRLAERLEEYAATKLEERDLVPALRIESVVPVERAGLDLCGELARLAPFGMGNPVPLLASRGVQVAAGPWILKDVHLKMQVGSNGSTVNAIWWRHAELRDRVREGGRVDIAYTCDRNVYRGEEEVLLTVRDLRESRPAAAPPASA